MVKRRLVEAKGCYIFFGIMPPREPGDVEPAELAVALGWTTDPPAEDYDPWLAAVVHLAQHGLGMDVIDCDYYPLAHIYADGTYIDCEQEYPLAFTHLPSYTLEQRDELERLATKLGYDSPRWHLGTIPVE